MTNPARSHISLVVDRSGSMAGLMPEAQQAVRAFIAEQQKADGEATLFLVEFDAGAISGGLGAWYHVIHDGDIATAPDYVLTPRGMTALHDAIGKTIVETGQRLAAMAEDERPGHVFFVVQTDGQENSSREYRLQQVTEMIKDHESTWNWTFIFLAVGPDAFGASQAYAGTQMAGHNTVAMASTGASYAAGGQSLSSAIRGTRKGARDAAAAYAVDVDDEGNVSEANRAEPKPHVRPNLP